MESEKARAIRQVILDVVIDLINRKTGGGTKYINQRDEGYVHASLQEDNYRRQFTDTLKIVWKIIDISMLILLI